jgi:hypothetical protein
MRQLMERVVDECERQSLDLLSSTKLRADQLEDVSVVKETPLPEALPGVPAVIALDRLATWCSSRKR